MENFNIALSPQMGKGFSVKIIDDCAGIVSYRFSAVEKINRGLETVIFCYLPQEDLIVMNEDNKDFRLWAKVLPEYMHLDDRKKRIFRETVQNELEKTYGILENLSVADRICRIRRHRKAVRA